MEGLSGSAEVGLDASDAGTIHAFFICFIATVLLWLIGTHERNARMRRLLIFLVVAAGGQIRRHTKCTRHTHIRALTH
jgi:hypothetical protein